MIISHKNKFIFIHGRKTAGTSLMVDLLRYCGDEDICIGDVELAIKLGYLNWGWREAFSNVSIRDVLLLSTRYRKNKIESDIAHSDIVKSFFAQTYRRYQRSRVGLGSAHSSANDIKKEIGKSKWDEYFKFTIVRNPWDRIISFYYWRTRRFENRPKFKDFVSALYSNDERKIRQFNALGFDNYKLYSVEGEPDIDFFVRFENLDDDIKALKKRLKLTDSEPLPSEKKGVRPSSGGSLHCLDTIEMVGEMCKKEIELFDYSSPGCQTA